MFVEYLNVLIALLSSFVLNWRQEERMHCILLVKLLTILLQITMLKDSNLLNLFVQLL